MPELESVMLDEEVMQETAEGAEEETALTDEIPYLPPQASRTQPDKPAPEPLSFDAIRIGLASPEKVREWSRGAVTKPETINYRTLKPERDGLYCERIFGPSKDWECHCGKYKKIRFKGVICDRCGVEVTKASVRRERMGHIELAAPVSHIWYFKGIPSRMGLMLDLTPRQLDQVLYFASYIVLDPGETPLFYKQVLNEREYREAIEAYGAGSFRAGMGAESIKELLHAIDLDAESASMREELETASAQKKAKLVKRLEVVESFRSSGNKPEWMIMDAIPVLPPDLRPMVQLDGGRFATSDINDLYRRIINRNNRLARLLELGAPEIIVRNEKRMLQEAVDALIDNGRRGRAVTGPGNRALKSLSDMLKGKQGRFRQNLLGKRVDYSGRSVIVVGPELKIYQCGLPKEMAIELFKPFVMKELVQRGISHNVKNAKKMVERMQDEVWDVLEDVISEHPVMLNRAPTLHRLGIQAFEPILVEGKAIKLHPLVCTAFNADFDGDQMAVHLPLSVEAQSECRFMLLSSNNLLKPSDGGPVAVPSQDMVLGIYYLTMRRYADYTGTEREQEPEAVFETEAEALEAYRAYQIAKAEGKAKKMTPLERSTVIRVNVQPERNRWVICTMEDLLGHTFANMNQAILAYENGVISLHQKIYVGVSKEMPDGTTRHGRIECTLGRLLFNEIIPQDLGFVDRSVPGNELLPEIDFHVGKKQLKSILQHVINIHGATRTAEVLDAVKSMGYKYSTRAALTVSISDMVVPARKEEIIAEAQAKVDLTARNFRRGQLTEDERYKEVIEVWKAADRELTEEMIAGLDKYNNIFMMADSGARGSNEQIKQLVGMRGLMNDTTGHTIELPIKSNLREGLDVLEYFISAHGARKGMSDTALRTADSGYLTRRLVDVSQDLIVREVDCCADAIREEGESAIPYMEISAFAEGKDNQEVIESLQERMTGRFLAETVTDPDTGEVVLAANHMVTPHKAAAVMNALERAGRKSVKIRTVLSCRSHVGVCAKCYGSNMATGQPVQVGESIGIIAAQSIGEPGTQLTMRTFHTGGVAGGDTGNGDITQGLPRVEELFEARKPKGLAIVAEFGGQVTKRDSRKKREVVVTDNETGNSKAYLIPYGSTVKVNDGDVIEAGDELTEGSVNPHDLLKIKGVRAVQDYMLREVQRVYRLQGVEINDKHIEVIVRQMLKKVRVEESGDSTVLPGTTMDVLDFEDMNKALEAEGKEPAAGKQIMLGITKASLATDSFLSAASFQETTKVLTEAAINGRVDHLIGLKENVIIGKLIPAGTGMKRYRDVRITSENDVPRVVVPEEELPAAETAEAEAEAPAEAEAAVEEITVEAEGTVETEE